MRCVRSDLSNGHKAGHMQSSFPIDFSILSFYQDNRGEILVSPLLRPLSHCSVEPCKTWQRTSLQWLPCSARFHCCQMGNMTHPGHETEHTVFSHQCLTAYLRPPPHIWGQYIPALFIFIKKIRLCYLNTLEKNPTNQLKKKKTLFCCFFSPLFLYFLIIAQGESGSPS